MDAHAALGDTQLKVGVVVGRFQIDRLHTGHQDLLDAVAQRSDVLIVVLGGNENRGSKRNPLDFIARKAMIEEWFAKECDADITGRHLVVMFQQDQASDEVWSQNLDRMVRQAFPGASITLYGGRDSFLKHYKGKILTEDLTSTLETRQGISATSVRAEIGKVPGTTDEFRRGVIYGSQNTWPRLFMCVDIAILDDLKLIVGKRNTEKRLRFFGGFVDQADADLEHAALREALEESKVMNIGLRDFKYVGSFKVPDYRYKSADDGLVMTTLFKLKVPAGQSEYMRAGDDIDELVELDLSESPWNHIDRMVDSHQPLMEKLIQNLIDEGTLKP